MHIYLKGYYGYRNIGDEVLLLGVITYLVNNHDVTSITLETDDPKRMSDRIQKHRHHVAVDMTCVDRNRSVVRKIREAIRSLFGYFPLLVLGGGEVINNHLKRPRNGWQYLIQYPGIMLRTQRYMILGGITIDPTHPGRHIRTLLRHARAVILRDKTSYEYAKAISPDNASLYHDWAYDALEQFDVSKTVDQTSNYVLLNIHPHILCDHPEMLKKINERMRHHADKVIYFIPGDLCQDREAYDLLVSDYPALQRRDRSSQSLVEILEFFAGAESVAASRLHLLLLMQVVGHEPTVFSYHPKIQKVLGLIS